MNKSNSNKQESVNSNDEAQIERFDLVDDRFTVEIPSEIRAGASAGCCNCSMMA